MTNSQLGNVTPGPNVLKHKTEISINDEEYGMKASNDWLVYMSRGYVCIESTNP